MRNGKVRPRGVFAASEKADQSGLRRGETMQVGTRQMTLDELKKVPTEMVSTFNFRFELNYSAASMITARLSSIVVNTLVLPSDLTTN